MKFVIYNGQNKVTVDHVIIPEEILDEEIPLTIKYSLYDFCITSEFADDDEEFKNEHFPTIEDEGIMWKQETIN